MMKIKDLVQNNGFDMNCNFIIEGYDGRVLFNSLEDPWGDIESYLNNWIGYITTHMYNDIPIIVFEI